MQGIGSKADAHREYLEAAGSNVAAQCEYLEADVATNAGDDAAAAQEAIASAGKPAAKIKKQVQKPSGEKSTKDHSKGKHGHSKRRDDKTRKQSKEKLVVDSSALEVDMTYWYQWNEITSPEWNRSYDKILSESLPFLSSARLMIDSTNVLRGLQLYNEVVDEATEDSLIKWVRDVLMTESVPGLRARKYDFGRHHAAPLPEPVLCAISDLIESGLITESEAPDTAMISVCKPGDYIPNRGAAAAVGCPVVVLSLQSDSSMIFSTKDRPDRQLPVHCSRRSALRLEGPSASLAMHRMADVQDHHISITLRKSSPRQGRQPEPVRCTWTQQDQERQEEQLQRYHRQQVMMQKKRMLMEQSQFQQI